MKASLFVLLAAVALAALISAHVAQAASSESRFIKKAFNGVKKAAKKVASTAQKVENAAWKHGGKIASKVPGGKAAFGVIKQGYDLKKKYSNAKMNALLNPKKTFNTIKGAVKNPKGAFNSAKNFAKGEVKKFNGHIKK